MKNKYYIIIILLLTVLFSGCADNEIIIQCVKGHTYGFWGGFWHGIITPFSFIGSLFSDDITVYAINNNGGWYDFGFLLGIGGLGFGSSKC